MKKFFENLNTACNTPDNIWLMISSVIVILSTLFVAVLVFVVAALKFPLLLIPVIWLAALSRMIYAGVTGK